MFYLLVGSLIHGLVPLIGLLNVNKVTFFITAVAFTVPFLFFFLDKQFLNKNKKHLIISAIIRGTASLLYYKAYDVGYGPVIVSLIFIQPVLISILDSFFVKKITNIGLVVLASVGSFLLIGEYPDIDFASFDFFLALISPLLFALSVIHFKHYLNPVNMKETINVILVRNIYLLVVSFLLFPIDFNMSSVDLCYSFLFGLIVMGFSMVALFISVKRVKTYVYSIVINLENVISFFVMLLVFQLEPSATQWIGVVLIAVSIIILKFKTGDLVLFLKYLFKSKKIKD